MDEPRPLPGATTPDPFLRAMGRRVRALRDGQGLSLTELAERAAISRTFLWRAETGRQGFTVRTLAQVAAVFGITAAEVLSGLTLPPTGADADP